MPSRMRSSPNASSRPGSRRRPGRPRPRTAPTRPASGYSRCAITSPSGPALASHHSEVGQPRTRARPGGPPCSERDDVGGEADDQGDRLVHLDVVEPDALDRGELPLVAVGDVRARATAARRSTSSSQGWRAAVGELDLGDQPQPVAQRARHRRERRAAERLVDHQHDEVVAVGDVGVERHRADPQPLGQHAHRQRVRGPRASASSMASSTHLVEGQPLPRPPLGRRLVRPGTTWRHSSGSTGSGSAGTARSLTTPYAVRNKCYSPVVQLRTSYEIGVR